MSHYLLQVAYTPEAAAALVKNPQDRLEAVRPVAKRLGGTVDNQWMSLGEYDIVAVINMPDSVSAAAFALAVSAGGACRAVKTTSLLSVEEGIAAMRKAATAEYRPPEHYDYRVGYGRPVLTAGR